MTLTPEQIERRKTIIGASEVAKILNLSHFGNAHDVFLEKTGQLEPDEKASGPAQAGNYFEGGVMAWAEDQIGNILRPADDDDLYRRADSCRLGALLDGILTSTGEPVDGKTSNLYGFQGSDWSEQWGQDGTDQVPDSHIIQISAQLIALNDPSIERGYLPTFVGGRGFLMFTIPRNPAVIDAIIAAVDTFWNAVKTDTPPDITPSLDVVRRVRRTPKAVTQIDVGLIEHWREMESSMKAVKESVSTAKAAVLSAMGDAEACLMTDAGAVTFLEQTSRRLDQKAFREAHPDLFEEFKRESVSRVMRYKKVPKAKKLTGK